MNSMRSTGRTTPDMTPMVGIGLTKSNVLRHLEPAGASLGVRDLNRRMPGASAEEIKQALRELVSEGMVEVAFRSTDAGKKFYIPPR